MVSHLLVFWMLFVLELCCLKWVNCETLYYFCFFSPLSLETVTNLPDFVFSVLQHIHTRMKMMMMISGELVVPKCYHKLNYLSICSLALLTGVKHFIVYILRLGFQYVYLTHTAYVWINHIGFIMVSFWIDCTPPNSLFLSCKKWEEKSPQQRDKFFLLSFYFHKNSWIMSKGISVRQNAGLLSSWWLLGSLYSLVFGYSTGNTAYRNEMSISFMYLLSSLYTCGY